MIRFLERNGYDVSYTTGVDTDRNGALIKNHAMFMDSGHDEYWSGGQRANVEAARDAGVNLAFFSGNEMFWKTRWEGSKAGPATANRTLITYKDTHFNAQVDPTATWTGTWRDPRFSPPGDGGRPENGLTGMAFMVDPPTDSNLRCPAEYAKLRFWRNTAGHLGSQASSVTLADATLGYEFDADLDNGFRPAGLFHSPSTTRAAQSKLQDYGNTVGPGTATHTMTLYRASSGALVFGAGTVQWSWGLDANHDGPQSSDGRRACSRRRSTSSPTWARSPRRCMTGMVAATQSTDTTKPTSTITARHRARSPRHAVHDHRHGHRHRRRLVGGVEVSTDGGATWHPATGTSSWTLHVHADRAGQRDGQGQGDRRQRQHPGRDVGHADGRPADLPVHALSATSRRTRPGRRRLGVRAGHAVPLRRRRLRHRGALLQGHQQHRHAHRQPVEQHRPATRDRHVHRGDGDRLADS